MSKFQVGDKVRVKQMTDVDQNPPVIITDPSHPDARDWCGVPLIGLVGTVVETWSEGHWSEGQFTTSVVFDHMSEGETASFVDDDLELYKNPNIQLGVNFFE